MRVFILFLILSIKAYSSDSCHHDLIYYNNIEQVFGIINSDKLSDCQSLIPGTFKDINIHEDDSLTGVEHAYRLSRTKEGAYKVTFNIKFFNDQEFVPEAFDYNGSDNYKVDYVLTKKWKEKSKQCLNEAKGKARGPQNEELIFDIYEGPDDDKAPPLKIIGIRKKGRAHSHSWTEDLNCSTILHELLHLAGLVDEYPEKENGYIKDPTTGKWKFVKENAEKIAYDCRKIYENNSIMANDENAWIEANNNWDVKVDICDCQNANECKSYFDKEKKKYEDYANNKIKYTLPNRCPVAFKKSKLSINYSISDEIKKTYDDTGKLMVGMMLLPEGITPEDMQKPHAYNITKRDYPGNLIEARHFNAIVFPGCINKNRTYYEDSLNNMRTSKNRGGRGCYKLRTSPES